MIALRYVQTNNAGHKTGLSDGLSAPQSVGEFFSGIWNGISGSADQYGRSIDETRKAVDSAAKTTQDLIATANKMMNVIAPTAIVMGLLVGSYLFTGTWANIKQIRK